MSLGPSSVHPASKPAPGIGLVGKGHADVLNIRRACWSARACLSRAWSVRTLRLADPQR